MNEDEDYPEYSRHTANLTTMTVIMSSVILIVVTLILFFTDTTKPIVGLVLFFLLLSMSLLGYCTGLFMAVSFTHIKDKPEATTEIKVGNSVFLFAQVLMTVGMDFLFLIEDLVYHFTVAVVLTIIVYGVLATYIFPKAWKNRI